MNIQELRVSDLSFDPHQTRIHTPDNLAVIKASLLEHGQVETLLVREGYNYVLAGNGRLRVMRELGWESVVCNLISLTDVQAKKLSTRMNRAGELAKWDEAALGELLRDIIAEGENPEDMGFSAEYTDRLLAQMTSELSEHADTVPLDEATLAASFEDQPLQQSIQPAATQALGTPSGPGAPTLAPVGAAKDQVIADTLADPDLAGFVKPEEDLARQANDAPQAVAPVPDRNWFYVEYYGEDSKFAEIKMMLKPFMRTEHEINSEDFYKMAMVYHKVTSGQSK